MNILFVCTGNTCRSPLAAAMANKLIPTANSSSAGIFALPGQKASLEMINTASRYGIDLTKHTSRQVNREMLEQADLILTMTTQHKQALLRAFADVEGLHRKIFTLSEYVKAGGEIADPYGQGQAMYDLSGEQIYTLIKALKATLEGRCV